MADMVHAYGARQPSGPVEPMDIRRRSTGATDVRIDIQFCGICHSDLHRVRNDWENSHFPIVPGHEIVGRVSEAGAEVERFRRGDLVGVGCLVNSCRSCRACLEGHEMFCERGAKYTFGSPDQEEGPWTNGGYSTSIVVDERYVLRMPDGVDPARSAPLLCAGITTYSPLRQFACKPGEHVAVVGFGGLGHLAVKLASSMGAEVTVLSSSPAKAEDAAKFGARRFVRGTDREAMQELEGSFDLILDTASGAHDLTGSVNLLADFGTLVLLGLPPSGTAIASVAASSLIHGNKRVAGSNIGGLRQTQEMLDHCRQHGVSAEVEVIGADQIDRAYERMDRGDVRYRFVIDCATMAP